MTNDTTTLNGSLLEMKDQLIYELGQKGVTATYSSSTGLLGLISKIRDIHGYKIDFNESSYTATGGSATISCTLYEDYVLKSGATVTFTGSNSSSYSGITNNSGVASVTVSNLSSDTSFTCHYSNVSDTCTVTVPTASYSLAFSQSTYITDMMMGVDVSCTLTNGGTPVSGETVTFSWDDIISGPQSVTATTNNMGVATHHFEYWDITGYPISITATYQGASATCTIEDGLF